MDETHAAFPPRMRIIAASQGEVRLVCEACGAHRVVATKRLGPVARCSTCDANRPVLDRRTRDTGHVPDRRSAQWRL